MANEKKFVPYNQRRVADRVSYSPPPQPKASRYEDRLEAALLNLVKAALAAPNDEAGEEVAKVARTVAAMIDFEMDPGDRAERESAEFEERFGW